jgi:hypothetical protein
VRDFLFFGGFMKRDFSWSFIKYCFKKIDIGVSCAGVKLKGF